MWLLGIMTYLFPRLFGVPWHSQSLSEWHFWLSGVGIFVMASDLIMAGVFQGYWWAALLPWEASVDGSFPFWVVRVFAGLAMFAGQIVFVCNIYLTWQDSRAVRHVAVAGA
jgi:cbb3-type cytochrome oxidase subunit 1